MAPSPQLEDGYVQIAREIVEALCRVNLSAYESRVLWFIFLKTYGFKKKMDWIALSQFAKSLGLDRRLVHRALQSLSSKKMTVIGRDDKNRPTYGFQKDYSLWKVSSKKMTVISRDDALSSKEIPTKETLTKEDIANDKRSPKFSYLNGRSEKSKIPVPGFKEAMATYHDLFISKFGAKPDIDGRDGKLLSGLVKSHGSDQVIELLDFFFEHPPAWVEKNSKFTIPAFKSAYTEILAQRRNGKAHQAGGFVG